MAITRGIIFDIKKFAIDDGPGIRTTVFFKGCPLRCRWCHNPEGQLSTPELMYRRMRCDRCAKCVKACPEGAISCLSQRLSISRNHCNLCGECCRQCPTEALAVVGKEMSLREVLSEIDKDSVFYEESDGGVTFSGGEPLYQLNFLNVLLKECKGRNIHTAVDTCGYVSQGAVAKISDKVELFLYDIKLMDEKKHRRYTGVSNKPILENLKMLAENGSKILARFPVIPGVNDGEDNVAKTGEFLISCGVENVNILPYHRSGTEKYRGLGRPYRLNKVQSPSDQSLNLIQKELEAFGLRVRIGG